jgi:putative endonuclease
MAAHNELGKQGESLAVSHLLQKGYTVLHTNWTFQKAEVDILAQLGNTLAVIEVKTRTSAHFGDPQDFVTPKKIQLMVKAVSAYIEQQNLDVEVRFDIIAITMPKSTNPNEKPSLEHLENAFYHF